MAIPILTFEFVVHAVERVSGPLFPGGPRTLSFSQPDPMLGWTHQIDFEQRYGWPEHPEGSVTIATNNLGLREDLPTTSRPPPGVGRILALGDSQTDGLVNNDESWPNVAEAAARSRDLPWEVLNAGVTGYRLWHYYYWWERFGRSLAPDVVLVGYYVGNDLATGAPEAETLDRGVSAEANVDESTGGFLAALRGTCRLCAVVSLVAHRTLLEGPTYEEAMFVGDAQTEEGLRYLEAARHCLGCLWQSVEQQWRVSMDGTSYMRELQLTEEMFERLRRDVVEADAILVVVLLPTKLQVEPRAFVEADRTARLLGMEGIDPTFENRLEADLHELLQTLDIPVIEVKSALERAHRTSRHPMYYDADWHLNVEGSRVVGERVATALRNMSRLGSIGGPQ